MTRIASKTKNFDKYYYYNASVQSADSDVEFMFKTYKKLRKKKPVTMREDFCGTHALTCEWVKLNDKTKGVGVDLDPEPIAYGAKHYQPKLSKSQQKRVKILNKNVLAKGLPEADLVCALNFSYFIFKERKQLVSYFTNVRKSLNKDGVFIVDCFGGTECSEANECETEYDHYSYFWDQDNFNPVNNNALFYIHFKRKGEKKRTKVFTYDWRMWTIPEIREMMLEAGFKKAKVYWEGTDKDGEGDGNFTPTEEGEECDSWVSYIVGMK